MRRAAPSAHDPTPRDRLTADSKSSVQRLRGRRHDPSPRQDPYNGLLGDPGPAQYFQPTSTVCVVLNVLKAGHPPSTVGSR
jgi:hypothetical protein